jgi:hypothetical protein
MAVKCSVTAAMTLKRKGKAAMAAVEGDTAVITWVAAAVADGVAAEEEIGRPAGVDPSA